MEGINNGDSEREEEFIRFCLSNTSSGTYIVGYIFLNTRTYSISASPTPWANLYKCQCVLPTVKNTPRYSIKDPFIATTTKKTYYVFDSDAGCCKFANGDESNKEWKDSMPFGSASVALSPLSHSLGVQELPKFLHHSSLH